jgi:hypothetical protein
VLETRVKKWEFTPQTQLMSADDVSGSYWQTKTAADVTSLRQQWFFPSFQVNARILRVDLVKKSIFWVASIIFTTISSLSSSHTLVQYAPESALSVVGFRQAAFVARC